MEAKRGVARVAAALVAAVAGALTLGAVGFFLAGVIGDALIFNFGDSGKGMEWLPVGALAGAGIGAVLGASLVLCRSGRAE